jgi:hypothetical protein
MLVLAGTLLAVAAAAATALFVVGLAALLERRWRHGALNLAASVASIVVLMIALSWTARSLISGDTWTGAVAPEEKARILAENISALMNVSALGLPTGLIVGLLLIWRRRARAKAR